MLFYAYMQWLDLFHSVTNRIAVTVLIILVGFIIGRVIGRLIFRILDEFEVDSLFRKGSSVEKGISQVFEYVIYVVTVCIALDNLGIIAHVLIALIVIIVLIVSVSALLGFKDFVPNFLCSLWIRKKGLAGVGTYVNLGDIRGKVIKKGILNIKVQTKSRDIISVPCLTVLKKKFR